MKRIILILCLLVSMPASVYAAVFSANKQEVGQQGLGSDFKKSFEDALKAALEISSPDTLPVSRLLVRFLQHAYVNTKNRQEILNFGADKHILSIGSASSRLVIIPVPANDRSRQTNNEMIIWDLNKRALHLLISGLPNPLVQAMVTPDGNMVIAADNKHQVGIWDLNTGKKIRDLGPHYLNTMALSYDGSQLVTNTAHTIFVWDVKTGAKLNEIRTPHDLKDAAHIAIDPCGEEVAIESQGIVYLFHIKTGRECEKIVIPSEAKNLNVQLMHYSLTESKLIIYYVEEGWLRKYCRCIWDCSARHMTSTHCSSDHETYIVGHRETHQKNNHAFVTVHDYKTGYWLCCHPIKRDLHAMRRNYAVNDNWFICTACDGKKIFAWNLNAMQEDHTCDKWDGMNREILRSLGNCDARALKLLGAIREQAITDGKFQITQSNLSKASEFGALPPLFKFILKDYIALG